MTFIRGFFSIALLVCGAACTEGPQIARTSDPCTDARYHSDLQDAGCVYEAQGLSMAEGLNAAPVWVFYGYLHKHADGFRLHVMDDPHAAFMALDLTKLPKAEVPYGLEPLIGWRTRIIGYYTSGDVATPPDFDATGTLQVLSIGYIADPARPRGAYDTAARKGHIEPSRQTEAEIY